MDLLGVGDVEDLENARDYYEKWFAQLKEVHKDDPDNTYMRDISPYFEAP